MFVRITWKAPSGARIDPRSLRRVAPIPQRGHDELCTLNRDFHKMTLTLFDRQD